MEKHSKNANVNSPTPLHIPKVGKQSTSNDKGDNSSTYRCDLCGKTYAQLSHLENHRTITHSLTLRIKHSNSQNTNHHYRSQQVSLDGAIKSHKCEECGKFFTRGYHLDRHKLIHTGIRPYKCTVCQKEFTRNYHLDRHMYTHTGEKPYSCEVCAKAFSRTDKLKKHLLTHLAPAYKEIRWTKPQDSIFCNVLHLQLNKFLFVTFIFFFIFFFFFPKISICFRCHLKFLCRRHDQFVNQMAQVHI